MWRCRRFCDNCGERHLEIHTRLDGDLTRRFAHTLVQDARRMSIREDSRHDAVGWHRIMRLVDAESARVAKRRRCAAVPEVTGGRDVDTRRHSALTMVAYGETGRSSLRIEARLGFGTYSIRGVLTLRQRLDSVEKPIRGNATTKPEPKLQLKLQLAPPASDSEIQRALRPVI